MNSFGTIVRNDFKGGKYRSVVSSVLPCVPPTFCKLILFIKKFQNIESFVSVKKWGKPASMNLNTQKRKFRNQLKGILYRKRRERSVPMAIFHVGVVAIR